MKKRWFLIGVIFLLISCLLVGCGVSTGVYNAVLAERDAAQTQVTNLQSEISATQDKYDDLKADYDEVKANFDELTADYDDLNTDYEATSEELAEIKMVYPPGDFKSATELESWVRDHVQLSGTYLDEDFRSALKIQSQGLEDGYLISVVFDEDDTDPEYGWIFCAALVNGVYYTWYPYDTEVYSMTGWDLIR